MNKASITINGVEYEPIDSPSNGQIDNCLDCDIFKAKPPLLMMEVPICCEEEFIGVNESCCELSEKGIRRIWKKKEVRAMSKEVLSLKHIIHPATESPGKKAFYLFFLDPRGDKPIMMEYARFLAPDVKPSTVVWKCGGYQRLPLFWIYREDFLKAIEYSEWAKEYEQDVVYDACFAFPDYEVCKANKKGKEV